MHVFGFDTYQQVRRNLIAALSVLLAAGGTLFVTFAMSPADQTDLAAAVGSIDALKLLTVPVVIGLASIVLIEFVHIHDLYDRYVVRWRNDYDVNVIITRLLFPFAEHVDSRFLTAARANRSDFMTRIFYHFTRDRDNVISKNTLVRFWERMTVYWTAQLAEIVLLVVLGSNLILHVVRPRDEHFYFAYALLLAIVVNRIWIRVSRRAVMRATSAELDEITERHRDDLRARIRDVAERYQVRHTL